jgi:hypothetical protein
VNISIVADFTKSIAGSRPVGRYFSKIIKRRFTGSSPVCRNDPALENCARPPHLLAGSTSPSSAALRFLRGWNLFYYLPVLLLIVSITRTLCVLGAARYDVGKGEKRHDLLDTEERAPVSTAVWSR